MMACACIYPKSTKLDVFSIYDLCFITEEQEDYYIGHWEFGFGFIGVKFPKNYTRELFWYEKLKYSTSKVAINNSFSYQLDISYNNYPDIVQMLEDIKTF